ncbi:hypothetical protein BH09SUM1_BH09SUM1_03750 [soil metagenome]
MAGANITQNLQGIGPYRLTNLLGFNGSFATFEGLQKDGGQRVLIVVVQRAFIKDDHAWDEFRSQFEELAKARANRICHALSCGEEAGHLYAAYEWLEGSHLGVRVRDEGLPDAGEAFRWISEIADALAALHRKGSVHGVISPASIFVTKQGDARLLHGAWGRVILGSEGGLMNPAWGCILPFAAPEVAAGKRGDEGSDVYSLGANLYFLISGQPPFWHEDPKTLMELIASTPIDLSGLEGNIPVAGIEALSEMVNHDPDERPMNLPALSDRLLSISRQIRASSSQGEGDVQMPATQLEMRKQQGPDLLIPATAPPADPVPAARPVRPEVVREAVIPPPAGPASGVIVLDQEVLSKKEQSKRMIMIVGASLIVLAAVGILAVYGITSMLSGKGDDEDPAPVPAKKIVINVPASVTPEKIKNYDMTLTNLRSLAQLSIGFQRDNGAWPTKIADLVPLGAKPEELNDAWGQPIEIRSTYVLSAGEDKTWDNGDDVWWDAQQNIKGGYTPDRSRVSIAPKEEPAAKPETK